MGNIDARYEGLDFVTLADGIYDFWRVDHTGTYAAQCSRGNVFAEQLILVAQREGNSNLLAAVVRAIARHGVFDGVEAGFLGALGRALLQSDAGIINQSVNITQ